MSGQKTYAEVIMPIRLSNTFTYCVPGNLQDVKPGSWVTADLRGKKHTGIVKSVGTAAPEGIPEEKVQTIREVLDRPAVRREEICFWQDIADYYMCSVGSVFKAAYNCVLTNIDDDRTGGTPRRRRTKTATSETEAPGTLSEAQATAYSAIESAFAGSRRVILKGVTGSGKTEIYMHLAKEQIDAGRQVLYLVPEIAISKQLQQRLEKVFGERLLVFHSRLTSKARKAVIDKLASSSDPCIVLGTRSAVLLPMSGLGLIIVDEEHDQSYKQTDPAPRYNGRDAAALLSARRGANLIMGSATPSYEALFNVATGKFVQVGLDCKFHGNIAPSVRIVDTNRERRLGNMRGSFAASTVNEIRKTMDDGGQVLVFRSRRSYAPYVQCVECGDIPKCPKCNVSLSYHKQGNSLSCHYCGYHRPFTTRCGSCGELSLSYRGAGTEKVEEELKDLFPDKSIARFDAETTSSKTREEKLIRDFSAHRIDILVGTQMITKGFDFERLSLVVLLNADSLFAVQDFRSDERASQLITQLLGRAGRRDTPGRMIIQTGQPGHPVLSGAADPSDGLNERRMFNYPPYVRLLTISAKDRNEGRLWNACRMIQDALADCGISDVTGPVAPAVPVVDKFLIREFWVRLERNKNNAPVKRALYYRLEAIEKELKGGTAITADVDPL